MTRDEAISLARLHALEQGEHAGGEEQHYLPCTEGAAKLWDPHRWVVDAILEAANGETQDQTVRRTVRRTT